MGRQISLYAIDFDVLRTVADRFRRRLERAGLDPALADVDEQFELLFDSEMADWLAGLTYFADSQKQRGVIELGTTPTKDLSAQFMELLIKKCSPFPRCYSDVFYLFSSPGALDDFLVALRKHSNLRSYFELSPRTHADAYLVFDSH